ATALERAGCRDAVELDRGSHHPAFLHRAGGATPPLANYETSVLYALGRPMLPRAFRWKPEGASPSTKVTSYDVGHPPPDDEPSRKKRKKEHEERERLRAAMSAEPPSEVPGAARARVETAEPRRH